MGGIVEAEAEEDDDNDRAIVVVAVDHLCSMGIAAAVMSSINTCR
jgi:hypothetical protein